MQSDLATEGIHHVTAVAGDPQANVDFYVETLGLRMVKKTVNHDDRYTYHLYYGDAEGTPGTSMTFFPWGEGSQQGRVGTGQVTTVAFGVPEGSLDYWADRLDGAGVDVDRGERFDDEYLRFEDPDGIELELVATTATGDATPWSDSPVPGEYQIRGFYGVTLSLADATATAEYLDAIGLDPAGEDDGRQRYRAPGDGIGKVVDLVEPDLPRGQGGVGTVHHVAFTANDVDEHDHWRQLAMDRGLSPTGVIDRKYFQSIYVRERGGVLFEFATTGPGFTADESVEDLGSSLALPEWLEDERESIESQLPELQHPLSSSREA